MNEIVDRQDAESLLRVLVIIAARLPDKDEGLFLKIDKEEAAKAISKFRLKYPKEE